MRQKTQCFCLILSVIVSGSRSAVWDMKVSPVVTVPQGEDAVLGCFFTHPRQQDYSGSIGVKWLARESRALPFFSCSVRNDSVDKLDDCSDSGLKFSLRGDPRRGELSLLVRRVHVADNGAYFCRVELDGRLRYFQRETQLYVTAAPRILSLSVVQTSSGSGSSPRRLQCEVEGHPLPSITWLSASGSPVEQVQTSQVGPYRLRSSVPYLEEDVLTCRGQSGLGAAERSFPDSQTLMIAVTVCGLIVLLLLVSGSICYLRNRVSSAAGGQASSVGAEAARDETAHIYGNADVVAEHRLQVSDPPAEGDIELHLVYSAVSLNTQHPSFKSSTEHLEETGVVYSPVNVP